MACFSVDVSFSGQNSGSDIVVPVQAVWVKISAEKSVSCGSFE